MPTLFAQVTHYEDLYIAEGLYRDGSKVFLDMNTKRSNLGRLFSSMPNKKNAEPLPGPGGEVARELWMATHSYSSHLSKDLPLYLKADIEVNITSLRETGIMYAELVDKTVLYLDLRPKSKTKGRLFQFEPTSSFGYKYPDNDPLLDPRNAVAQNIVEHYIAKEVEAHEVLRQLVKPS